MTPLNPSPASRISKSYVNAKGTLVLFEKPKAKIHRTIKEILTELPTSVLIMTAGMLLTQVYLLFNILQAIRTSATPKDISISLFIFSMLGVFICIVFKLGLALISEKEEARQKASLLKKALSLPKGLS